MSLNHEQLINKIQNTLDESVNALDGETRSQLTHARHQAVQTNHKSNHWLAISGFAFASVVALSTVLFNDFYIQNDSVDSLPVTMLESSEDLEMMVSIPDPELLENLDFYYWLEQGENSAG